MTDFLYFSFIHFKVGSQNNNFKDLFSNQSQIDILQGIPHNSTKYGILVCTSLIDLYQ